MALETDADMRRGNTVRRAVWVVLAVVFLCLVCLALWRIWRQGDSQDTAGTDAFGLSAHVLPAGADIADVGEGDDENIVYYRKANDNMEIALTFDDGPHPRYTPEILSILKEYGIRATFFMIGENVRYYSEAAEAVLAAGHEVGNHTDSHRRMRPLNEAELLSEIEGCEDAISSIAEYRPKFIRPPEGSFGGDDARVIGSLGYRIILWDVDTLDWAHTAPEDICANVCENVQSGDIILMHDFIGYDSPTPAALRLMIPALLEKGYKFVTVGELLGER